MMTRAREQAKANEPERRKGGNDGSLVNDEKGRTGKNLSLIPPKTTSNNNNGE